MLLFYCPSVFQDSFLCLADLIQLAALVSKVIIILLWKRQTLTKKLLPQNLLDEGNNKFFPFQFQIIPSLLLSAELQSASVKERQNMRLFPHIAQVRLIIRGVCILCRLMTFNHGLLNRKSFFCRQTVDAFVALRSFKYTCSKMFLNNIYIRTTWHCPTELVGKV